MTNSLLLKSLIVKSGLKQEDVAAKLNISNTAFNNKLNNKSEFKESEIAILIDLFKLKSEELKTIFFNVDVE